MNIAESIREYYSLKSQIEARIWEILKIMSEYSDDDLMIIVNDMAATLEYHLMGSDEVDSVYVTAQAEDRYDDLSWAVGYRIPLEYFDMDKQVIELSVQQMFLEEQKIMREKDIKSLEQQAEFYGYKLVKESE